MTSWTRRIVWLALLVMVLVFSWVERGVRAGYTSIPEYDRATILPDPSVAPLLSMGFANAWADLFLLEAQVSVSAQLTEGLYETGKRIKALLDLVHALDPHYTRAFLFGAAVLASFWDNMGVADGNELLLKAMRSNPEDYRIPRALGFAYYLYGEDYPENRHQAARWFRTCLAAYEDCPKGTVWMVDNLLLADHSVVDMHAAMICEMCESAEEDAQRRYLCERCRYYNLLLEFAPLCRAFEEQMGRPLATPQELVDHARLKALPKDPLGGDWVVDKGGCLASSEMKHSPANVGQD